ncbi:MAG: KamA family radical SAM protein [Kiritimatiellae bacterium]|nr:KamA family radical SAM protein [Kiritimatiellia bacterium]MDW8457973.1 KamA family radical SAM protein [Verrucomicrobiota bacterium]
MNLTTSRRRAAFRRRFYPSATLTDWNDWRWQLRHRITDLEGLERIFRLTEEEREAVRRLNRLPLGITPYYASLIDPVDPAHPLRRTKIPSLAEFQRYPGEYDDPLGEERHRVAPGLIHTYPDKVLFLVTDFCATYCRYCMRSRLVGQGTFIPNAAMWEEALAYIRAHAEVRDVLLSGGDPLILSDERLAWLLERLRAIRHVEIIRIGTKVPAVLPMRITPALCRTLRRFHPLFISIHFIHPEELTPETARACERLADAGIPLGGQMVLLKGINDDPETMRRLCQGQLRMRVRPYYLHQCDAIVGSMQFRTPIQAGLEIIRALHGHTSGYAVPTYMVDAPGGGGKVPLTPSYVVGRQGADLVIRNHAGALYRYYDPGAAPETGELPVRFEPGPSRG